MSSPTPGSDPDHPPGAPQSQPGWGPPQQQYGAPASSYPAAPADYGRSAAGGRPPQVLTAAVLGFVVALFLLLGALAFFALATVLVLFSVFGIIYLALAALNTWGGVAAIRGRSSTILTVAGAITAVLSLVGLISSLTQGDFSPTSLVAVLIGAGMVVLLRQPQSRAFFAAHRRG